MRLTRPVPVVFLACVNSYRMGKRLRYLVNERKGIARMLRQPNGDSWMIPVQKGNISLTHMLKHPHAARRFRRLEILHLIGHTDGDKIHLESEQFETQVSLHEIGAWLDRMPSLRLVFLSGCAFPALIDLLMKKDVPAVIATQTFEKDARATVLARKYYEQLLEGKNYWEAFMAIRPTFPELNALEVDYDLESDQILWPGRDAQSGPIVPWGMYFFKDRVELLKPQPAQYPLVPFSANNRMQHSVRREKKRRFVQMAAMALIGGILAVGLIMALQPLAEVPYVLASW